MSKENERFSFSACSGELAKYKIHAERKRVIVAFADVVGFAPWCQRAANSPEEMRHFITHLYKKFIHMKVDRGYFVKMMGDGAMFVKELSNGHNCGTVIEVLKEMNCLSDYILNLISRASFPRPDGFRVRLAVGYVSKLNMDMCRMRCSLQNDYVGYPVNLASRLLEFQRLNHPVIVHESVKDIIGDVKAAKAGIVFKPVKAKDSDMSGVDEIDLENLWSYTIDLKKTGKKKR